VHSLRSVGLALGLSASLAMCSARAQTTNQLPEVCGGADRASAQVDLRLYRDVFFGEDPDLRCGLDVQRLSPGAVSEPVDDPKLCRPLVRRVLEELNDGAVWQAPASPADRVHETDIGYEFLRYGPYVLAIVMPPEDARASIEGGVTALVFRAEDLSFLGSFIG